MCANAPVDARQRAASLVEHLQPFPLEGTVCCYGNRERALVGIGRASSLELSGARTFDSLWAKVNEFIEANSDEYIGGFIGFDPANELNSKVHSYRQKVDLFVPEQVFECSQSGCTVHKGDLDVSSLQAKVNGTSLNRIDIGNLDLADLRRQYAKSVADLIDAIRAGSIERATLARKVESGRNFDLLATFLSDHSTHEVARSFYFSNTDVAFAGQCPEVLAEGDRDEFATHKLSGTYAKNGSEPLEQLAARFRSDERIISEHKSAITSIEESLSRIGAVQSSKFNVMELPLLLHGWTRFITCPDKNVSVAECLRAVFPFGIKPVKAGFDLLVQHEDFCRGPYYGVTGIVRPDGRFSFTQILRSAFVDREGSYLMVGAAITKRSTAELETKETSAKLSSIQVYERAD